MFCPACGSENEMEKSYCRRCGRSLVAVRLALDGRVDQAIKIATKDQSKFRYVVRMALSVFLILVAIATIFSKGWFGFSNLQSAAVILIIMLLVLMQNVQHSRGIARLLNPGTPISPQPLPQTDEGALNPPPKQVNAPVIAPNPSITEQDTLRLDG